MTDCRKLFVRCKTQKPDGWCALKHGKKGFALAPILYLIALAGVAGTVLFTGYTQILRSNVEITADNAVRNQIRMATEVLASKALINGTPPDLIPQTAKDWAALEATRLPKNASGSAAIAENDVKSDATSVGGLPAGGGVKQLDPWGRLFIYCRWQSPQSPGDGKSMAIISAGADGKLATTCANTLPATGSDDRMEFLSVSNVLSRAATWQAAPNVANTYQFGVDPSAAKVAIGLDASSIDQTRSLDIGGRGRFRGDLQVDGNLSVNGNSTTLGDVNSGATVANSLAVTTTASIGTNLTVGGTSTLAGDLSVAGVTTMSSVTAGALTASTVTSSGAVDAGSLTVSGASTLADLSAANATLGTLGVSGTAIVSNLLTAGGGLRVATITPVGANVTLTGNLIVNPTVQATNGVFTNLTVTNPIAGSITGSAGTVPATGITGVVPLSSGGTGYAAASDSDLLAHWGLVVGVNIQSWDADLDALAALTSTGFVRRTGAGSFNAGPILQMEVPAFMGATSGAAGSLGGVPMPASGQQAYILRGDGTWVSPSGLAIDTTSSGDSKVEVIDTGAGIIKFTIDGSEQARITGTPAATDTVKITGGKAGVPASISAVRSSDGTTSASLVVNGDLAGNASTATKLQTARTIGTSGDITATATAFDGTANITIPTTVAKLQGVAIASTAPIAGNVLTYDGTNWKPGSVSGNNIDGGVIGSGSGTELILPDGTVGVPALRFKNNLNMGLYRPAADSMGLVTAGIERIRIDGNGNMAIGSADPRLGHLSLSLTDNRFFAITGGGTDSAASRGTIIFGNNRPTPAAGDFLGTIHFLSTNMTVPSTDYKRGASISAFLEGTGGANGFGGAMTFSTKGDNAAMSTRMRLDSAGHLSLGIAAPVAMPLVGRKILSVGGDTDLGIIDLSTPAIDADATGVGMLTFSYPAVLSGDKRIAIIKAFSSGSTAGKRGGRLDFQMKGNDISSLITRMTLDQTGNLGIGGNFNNVTPSYAISLGGTAARTIGMERHTTADTAGNQLTINAGAATSGAMDKNGGDLLLASGVATGTGSSNIYFYTSTAGATGTADRATTAKMAILGNGRVGIGTNLPATRLDVAGGLRIADETTACSAALEGTMRYTTVLGYEACRSNAWVSLASAGSIGTGGGGLIANPLYFTPDASNNFTLGMQGSGTAAERQALRVNATAGTGAIQDITLVTGGVDRFSINNSGNTVVRGRLDVQSSTESLKIGADDTATTRTNNTIKTGRVGFVHYSNAAEPFAAMYGNSSSASNSLAIGGGTAGMNAATNIAFYTADTTTTSLGTQRMVIDNSGNVGIGGTPIASYRFAVNNSLTDIALQAVATRSNMVPAFTAANSSPALGSLSTVYPNVSGNFNITGNMAGSSNEAIIISGNNAGTMSSLVAVRSGYGIQTGGTGTVVNAYGFYAVPYHQAGVVTNSYGLFLANPTLGGTVTNEYGVYQQSATARNILMGNLGIGSTAPATRLDVVGGLKIANETTACSGTLEGTMRYTTALGYEACRSNAWVSLSSAGSVGTGGTGIVNLGSGTGAANPAIGGDLTSGFYTAGAGKVNVTISNAQVVEWTSAGEAITGALTATQASAITGAYAVRGAATGTSGATYGGYFSNATTGAGYGVYGSVTGGSNTGYAGYFANSSTTGWSVYSAGTAPNYFAGNVAVGVAEAVGQLANNSAATIDSYSASGLTAAKSLNWSSNGAGYVAGFRNDDAATINANGVIVKIAGTAGSNRLLTLNAGGTDVVAVQGDGKVGIGTTTPSYVLSLGGNIARTIGMERNSVSNVAGNSLTINAGAATSGATNKNGGDLLLASGVATGTGSSNIYFYTSAAGTTGTADRSVGTAKMAILGNGNVGIGTASPTDNLQIYGTSNTVAVMIYNAGPDGNGAEYKLLGGGASGTWAIGTNRTASGGSADNLYIYKNLGSNSAQLVVTDTGNVGFGTTTPNFTITLPNTASGMTAYNTTSQTANFERARQYWNSNVYTLATESIGTGVSRDLALASGNATFRLADSGYAIGSYNAKAAALADGSTGSIFGTAGILNGASGLQAGIVSTPTINQTGTGSYAGVLIDVAESATGSGTKRLIDAKTGGSSRFFINNSGKTSIGQTAEPATMLDIAGGVKIADETATCAAGIAGTMRYNATNNFQVCVSTDSGTTYDWKTVNVSNDVSNPLYFTADGSNNFAIGMKGSGTAAERQAIRVYATAATGVIQSITFATAGSDRVKIDSTGVNVTNSTNLTSVLQGNNLVFNRAANDSYIDQNGLGGTLKFRVSNAATNDITALTIIGNGNIGIAATNPSYSLSLGGGAARTIGMERITTVNTAGQNLTILAGGATSGATDKNGGDLLLASGVATGTGSSNIYFYTAPAGATGTADRAATASMTILGNGNVGIGETVPSARLMVRNINTDTTSVMTGTSSIVTPSYTAGTNAFMQTALFAAVYPRFTAAASVNSTLTAITADANLLASGGMTGAMITNFTGITSAYGIRSGSAGTIMNAYGLNVVPYHEAGTITNSYAVFIKSPSAGGVVTNEYGVYQQSATATNVFMGNIMIGDTAPTAKLDVNGPLRLRSDTTSACATVGAGAIRYNAGTFEGCNGTSWAGLSSLGGNAVTNPLYFTPDASNNFAIGMQGSGTAAERQAIRVNTTTATGAIQSIALATGGSDRIIIDNGGKVGMGVASPTEKLEVSANVKATAFINTSDARLKDKIATYQHGLDTIKKLRGVTFTWKKDGTPAVGLIAQEVEKVVPDVVRTGADGFKSVAYANLVAPLIEAVKELAAKFDDLAQKVASLMTWQSAADKRLEALERKLESLSDENAKLKTQIKEQGAAQDKKLQQIDAKVEQVKKAPVQKAKAKKPVQKPVVAAPVSLAQ